MRTLPHADEVPPTDVTRTGVRCSHDVTRGHLVHYQFRLSAGTRTWVPLYVSATYLFYLNKRLNIQRALDRFVISFHMPYYVDWDASWSGYVRSVCLDCCVSYTDSRCVTCFRSNLGGERPSVCGGGITDTRLWDLFPACHLHFNLLVYLHQHHLCFYQFMDSYELRSTLFTDVYMRFLLN